MGGGRFSYEAYESISVSKGYAGKSREQIFSSRSLDPEMDPSTIIKRESRDSAEHPESVSVIVALDVTGSMGFVPESLVKETLPHLVGTIIEAGIPDPQVLFLGIGDFYYDNAPLQVGQFESSAELLDRWLTKVFLEGGGGGNNHESYSLAHLLAARHTAFDSFEKRGQKGFLFTIGDEPCNEEIPSDFIKRLTTEKQAGTVTTKSIIAEAQEKWNVYHFHLEHDDASATDGRKGNWRELLGQNFIVLKDHNEISKRIAQFVIDGLKSSKNSPKDKSGSVEVEDML